MFSQVTVWFCILSATVASVIPDIITKVVDTLLERNKANKLRELERERKIKSENPGYVPHPNNEMVTMKRTSAHTKKNKVSDAGIDNSNFINDDLQVNIGSDTLVYTDPNVCFMIFRIMLFTF